jgi:hypothetical protein
MRHACKCPAGSADGLAPQWFVPITFGLRL